VTANQPVTQDQADIDSSTCMSSQLCIGLPDCIDKLLEIRFVRCGKL
jgi:hypothetical protein